MNKIIIALTALVVAVAGYFAITGGFNISIEREADKVEIVEPEIVAEEEAVETEVKTDVEVVIKDSELKKLQDKVTELEEKIEGKEMILQIEKSEFNAPDPSTHEITLTSPDPNGGTTLVYIPPTYIKGNVSEGAISITVTATGGGLHDKAYTDVYTLKNFKKGDRSFKYGISPQWGNLAAGNNKYLIEANYVNGKVAKKVEFNYLYEGNGEISFDGCGEAADYLNKPWGDHFMATIMKSSSNKNYQDIGGLISEMCYSKNANMVVAITYEEPGMCNTGQVWRYFINTGGIEEAKLDGNSLPSCNVVHMEEFLNRNGSNIGIVGNDDYGCAALGWPLKTNYQYNFITNSVKHLKTDRCQ